MFEQKHTRCFTKPRNLKCSGQHEKPVKFRIIFKASLIGNPFKIQYWYHFHHFLEITLNKMCYETQMPPYEANSRGGHHRQDFKIYGSSIKVLSQGTCIWNTKALSLTIQNMAKVKVFRKWVKFRGQKVKNYGTIRKFLSKETHKWNVKALSLTIQNIWPMLKFLKSGSTSGVGSYVGFFYAVEVFNKLVSLVKTSRSRSQGQRIWYQ
jgi:hypothetical protein